MRGGGLIEDLWYLKIGSNTNTVFFYQINRYIVFTGCRRKEANCLRIGLYTVFLRVQKLVIKIRIKFKLTRKSHWPTVGEKDRLTIKQGLNFIVEQKV